MRFAIIQDNPLAARGMQPALPAPMGAVRLDKDIVVDPAHPGARIHFSDSAPVRTEDLGADDFGLARLSVVEADSRESVVDWLRKSEAAEAGFEVRAIGCPGGLRGVDASTAETRSRFLVLVHADADTEAERAPSADRLQAMARRNDDAVEAGVLLSGDGLGSTAKALRVRRSGASVGVTDGPFAEAKELIAGYWLIQAESLEEAIDWVRSYPFAQDDPVVDVLPVAT